MKRKRDRFEVFELKKETPYLGEESIRYFNSILNPRFTAFEFGSGGSTLWLAKRVKNLYSVEQREDWAIYIYKKLNEFGASNATILYCSNMGKYAEYVSRFEDYSFDIIFVDGASRIECIENSIPKVNQGGFLIIDDSGRPYLIEYINEMQGWDRMEFVELKKYRGCIPGNEGKIINSRTMFLKKR